MYAYSICGNIDICVYMCVCVCVKTRETEDVEYFNLQAVKDNANSIVGEIYCHV